MMEIMYAFQVVLKIKMTCTSMSHSILCNVLSTMPIYNKQSIIHIMAKVVIVTAPSSRVAPAVTLSSHDGEG